MNIQNNEGKLPIHIMLESTKHYYHRLTKSANKELMELISNSNYEEFNSNAQDKDGNTPLHIACKLGDILAVLYLTSNFECDVNLCNSDGYLPLHHAIGSYHGMSGASTFVEMVKVVSQKCTQLHKQNCDGMTPLHIACRNEWMDVVRYLVFDKKCSPNLCDSHDTYSSLDIHLACKEKSDIDLLKALANKLNVNNQKFTFYYYSRTGGNTPLHVACAHNNFQAIELLKELNCDFTRKNRKGMRPLHIACSKSLDCVKLLDIQNDDVKLCDENGNTPLHYACKHNLKDLVRYLMDNFMCVLTIQNKNNEFPLHLACNASLEIVQIVSDGKVNLNSQTKEGNTPLHIACRAGGTDIVKYLVATSKCDPSMKVRNGYDRLPVHYACMHSLEMMKMVDQTTTIKDLSTYYSKRISALDIACSHGSLDVVVYLINKKGCTLSALQNNNIALRYACGHCGEFINDNSLRPSDKDIWDDISNSSAHPKVVEYLITECGYDPSVTFTRDSYYHIGTSVIELACQKGNLDLIKALTVLSVDVIDEKGNTPLHYASKHSCTAIAQFLIIDHGCDQTITNHQGELALHIACSHSLQIVELLTSCDVNSLNKDANSPLHIACECEQEDIVLHLVEKRECNVNILNGRGESALHIACRLSLTITKLLKGCDVNSQDSDGNTALHIACINESHEIVKYLLQDELCCAEIRNDSGDLPLHIIIKDYQPDLALIMTMLQKCDVNSQDSDGNTALHIACINKNYEIVKHLLQDELCCAEIPNDSGDLPLHIIMNDYQPDLALIMTMVQKCDVNSRDSDGNTPLYIACSKLNHKLIMHLLQDKACRADIPNKRGELPLQCIIMKHFSISSIWSTSPRELNDAEKLQVIVMVADRYSRAATTADNRGLTPMDIIIRNGSIDLLTAFFKRDEINLDLFLHLACKHKQTKVVRWLIDHGANTEIIDDDGNLPEHVCISNDNPSLETLLQLGTLNVLWQNKLGNTVLHLACGTHVEKTVHIVQHISTASNFSDALSIQNYNGNTPLHILAIRELSPKMLSLIKCSSPNQKDSEGNTPLHVACKHNNIKFAELLLKLQCDPNIRNNRGELPLHIAASQSLGLVKLFGRSENVNSQTNNGDTPLHIACQCQRIKVILYLIIELKCSVQILNIRFDSPFHLLLNNSRVWDHSVLSHIPQSLRDTHNVDGDTLLHIACRNGNVKTVSFLVESLKCNVNVTNEKSGVTPLHFACGRRSINLVKLVSQSDPIAQLKDSCLLADIKCVSGVTPLHFACGGHSIKLVSQSDPIAQLKDSCLLADVKCVSGDTPLHVACKMGNLKVIRYLLIYGHTKALKVCNSQNELPFHLACHHNSEKAIKLFIPYRKYFDCNAVNGSGDTPLHMACSKNPTVSYIQLFVNQIKCKTDVVNRLNDLPLHIVCRGIIVYHKVVKMLSNELDEEQLSLQNSDGNTALHEFLKCSHDYHRSGNLIHLIQALTKKMPILSVYNKNDMQPIHLACHHQRLYVVRYLCKLLSRVKLPNSVLHETCLNDNVGVLKYIIENVKELDVDVPDENGDLPLHLATRKRRCVKGIDLLIKKTENVNYTNNQGNTPLYELYISCDNSQRFFSRASAYHSFDRLKVLSSFLARKDINLATKNSSGQTPLHLICESGNCEDLEVVIDSKKKINPNMQDNKGFTPLHILCQANQFKGVQLLCSANANPSVKDNQGRTPLTLTSDPKITNVLIECGADPQPLYDMHKEFFQTFSSDVPPPTPVKLLMIGNPSVGKTTLVYSLKNEGYERLILSDKFKHTTGIVTTNFSSKIYGDVMFYDFAGQREYYASHDAIIHSTIKNVPPIVLIVVNLTDKRKIICNQIHYWINFIAKRCASFNDKAHMIIICSHTDILESQGEDPSIKVSKLHETIKSRIDSNSSIIVLKEVLHMNCTEVNSKEIKRLQRVLKDSTNQLREGGVMLFNSHCFYVLLHQAFKDSKLSYVTLGHIINKLKFSSRDTRKSPLFLLSSDEEMVTEMCKDLDNRDHIMFIEHPSVVEMSWLVLNRQPLLHDLLGSLFAPSNFPQHRPLSYSTGVVPLSRFKECFGERYHYTATMKLTFLTRMEYCREITDNAVLESIVEQEGYSEIDKYYFFPNLVSLERPTDKWNTDLIYVYKCGWLIQCTKEGDFFSPHFIQALLLRLTFAFAPKNVSYDSSNIEDSEDESDEEENQAMAIVIKRVCSVWKNGLYWQERSGVKTIVDIIDQRTLVLLMQCRHGSEMQLLTRRSMIISMVLDAKKEFCSKSKVIEYFLHPQCVKHPLKNISKCRLFSLPQIEHCVISRDPCVINDLDDQIDLQELLLFEPYFELSKEVIKKLSNEASFHENVNNDLLSMIAGDINHQYPLFTCFSRTLGVRVTDRADLGTMEATDEIRKLAYILKQIMIIRKPKGATYQELYEFFNQMSIFYGRQPPQGMQH